MATAVTVAVAFHSTPLHSTPLHSTPLHSTPLHSPQQVEQVPPPAQAGDEVERLSNAKNVPEVYYVLVVSGLLEDLDLLLELGNVLGIRKQLDRLAGELLPSASRDGGVQARDAHGPVGTSAYHQVVVQEVATVPVTVEVEVEVARFGAEAGAGAGAETAAADQPG